MVWFKVDDTLAFHAKVVAAGNPAMGLWVRAGAWCSQQLTDGFVPKHMVTSLGTTRQARMLVTAGLWEEADGGYMFHDWSDGERQPTREQVENKREAWREKKRKQRRNSAGKFEVSPGDNQGDSSGESRRPVPSRPVPTNSSTYTGGTYVTREDEPPPDDPYQPEMSVNALLASAGLAQAEHRDFLVALKGNGARNTTALVNALYRDGKLPARIGEWRTERDLATEAASKPAKSSRVAAHADLVQQFAAQEAAQNVVPIRQIEGA